MYSIIQGCWFLLVYLVFLSFFKNIGFIIYKIIVINKLLLNVICNKYFYRYIIIIRYFVYIILKSIIVKCIQGFSKFYPNYIFIRLMNKFI